MMGSPVFYSRPGSLKAIPMVRAKHRAAHINLFEDSMNFKNYAILLIPVVILHPVFAKTPDVIFSHDTIISNNIEVPENATYIIKPGVCFQISGYCKIVVHGLLIAEGTGNRPITFTCLGRPRGSIDAPCWYGFIIMGKNSHGLFRHCRWEGAYRNLVWESNPVFDSCEFVGNHCGLYCTKKAMPHVKNCRFYRNVFGIVADFANPLLLDNVISDNTIGIDVQIGSQVVSGKNKVEHNQTNVRPEPGLIGDTGTSAMRNLWELMNELY
jgi:hypothetical protein